MTDTAAGLAGLKQILGSAFEAARAADPDYVDKIAGLAGVPYGRGALSPATRELVQVGIHGNITQFNTTALARHVRHALAAGATPEQVQEALQLVSVLGIHAGTTGLEVLMEEAEAAGKLERRWSSEQEEAFRERFTRERGFWNKSWEPLLALNPEFMEAYLDFSAHPWKTGSLEPKVREFIYIGIDVCVTHMFHSGTRQHIQNAFKHGATVIEIVEVMELASLVGVHSFATGVAALADSGVK